MYREFVAVLFSTLVKNSLAFSTGAPAAQCDDMFPAGHSVPATTTAAPFSISVPSDPYTPGVALESKETPLRKHIRVLQWVPQRNFASG